MTKMTKRNKGKMMGKMATRMKRTTKEKAIRNDPHPDPSALAAYMIQREEPPALESAALSARTARTPLPSLIVGIELESKEGICRFHYFGRCLSSNALGNDESDVIVLLGTAKLLDLFDDRWQQVPWRQFQVPPECFDEALFSEFFSG